MVVGLNSIPCVFHLCVNSAPEIYYAVWFLGYDMLDVDSFHIMGFKMRIMYNEWNSICQYTKDEGCLTS